MNFTARTLQTKPFNMKLIGRKLQQIASSTISWNESKLCAPTTLNPFHRLRRREKRNLLKINDQTINSITEWNVLWGRQSTNLISGRENDSFRINYIFRLERRSYFSPSGLPGFNWRETTRLKVYLAGRHPCFSTFHDGQFSKRVKETKTILRLKQTEDN